MPPIRMLEISGTPMEMGRQHGQAYTAEIQELAEERLVLSSDKNWTGRELARPDILTLAEACLPYHYAYSPELMEEIHGVSQITGVGISELVILNGFTDFVDAVYGFETVQPVAAHPAADDCTAFIVSSDAAADGQSFFGQTWDMHATATPFVLLLAGKPAGGLRFLTLTIIGCVGMIGMNEAGIAIGNNNLVARDGQVGVTWPFVVRKVLAQDNLDDALACITDVQLAGGHNYMLADANGKGYNVEAMATRYQVMEVDAGSEVHTNHCLFDCNIEVERERLPRSRLSSETRLNRAEQMLRPGQITLDDLFDLTRDHGASNGICVHPEAPFFLESCGAVIMRPASREMWAVWGNPCQNEYQRFVI